MPKFFFHIRDGKSLIPDRTGVEAASLSDARHEALETARCMMEDLAEIGDSIDGQTLEIWDENGSPVDVVPLSSARGTASRTGRLL